MSGTLVVVDAHPVGDRYGWLVTSEYGSRLLHAVSWGVALREFAPPPRALLLADPGAVDAAAVGSVMRICRALGVRVVCDASRLGPDALGAARSVGGVLWDGSRATAGEAFGAAGTG